MRAAASPLSAGGRGVNAEDPVWIPTAPPSLTEFLAFAPQPVPLLPAIGVVMAGLYLVGAISVWRSGRRWSVGRTLVFLSGCALTVVVTGAGIEGYGQVLFSVFMFQQLTLMMAVPPLLVLGAPGTLLLRALPHRGLGPVVHRLAVRALRSRVSRVLVHPGFALPLFLMSFYGLYLGGLADFFLATWAGHLGLEVFFLAAGIIFTIPVLSPDPLPRRQGYAGRLLDLFGEMALHAFFGVIVMMAANPLVRAFSSPPESWGVDVLYDQQIAGALSWSYGEFPTLIILLVLLPRWFRHDTARARAADRDADEHGSPELDAYNEYLAQLRARSDRASGGTGSN
jgi:putative membrane protein